MGSLTPPWAGELIARKSKIGRKMMSSMSIDSYLSPDIQPVDKEKRHAPNRFLSTSVPLPSRSGGLATDVNGDNPQVVDPSGVPTARMASSQSPIISPLTSSLNTRSVPSQLKLQHLSRNTEKLSPIRNERDSMFEEEETENKKGFEMTNGGEDLSVLEYGPGIVKKLRSRYQSLALRQYAARPTLRRSASLENCLDAVSAEELAATLESKISPSSPDPTDELGNTDDVGWERGRKENPSRDWSNRREQGKGREQQQQNGVGKATSGPRGRQAGPDASARRDRMRRARSVDALHRTKREEEILEKFKHVVLPKEEIVIIEVSKPQHDSVINSVNNGFIQDSKMGGGEKRYPTRLLLTSNNLRNSTTVLDQQTANRVRNLISPDHELPPHDIVRETARIFEKNQENLSRRIGQALRLSKSQSSVESSTGISSPPLTPPSPTPTTNTNNTSAADTQLSPVTAQSTTSSSMPMQADKSFPTPSSDANSTAPNNVANGPSHGQKQVGVIKPTLNSSSNVAGGRLLNTKVTNGEDRVRSPILSPIGFPSQNHKSLIQSSQKPPLSPKPIFTSSPKVTAPSGGSGGLVSAITSSLAKNLNRDSPSTSPILIIDRSISPLERESPTPGVNSSANIFGDTVRPKSPVSKSISPTNEERNDAFMRATSPLNGKSSPEQDRALKRLGNNVRTTSPENQSNINLGEDKTKTVINTSSQNGKSLVSDLVKDVKEPPRPRSTSPTVPDSGSKVAQSAQSQLRVHQKQKSSQPSNGSMVFNFTSRKQVPDYIEDDGLRTSQRGSGDGARTEGEDIPSKDSVDTRPVPLFEGANVIINGRSSIQKKRKPQKMSISFNEEATTTYEYPSESSFMIEEDPNESDNSLKKPNVVSGSSLGSYTPKVGSNAYQLGSYAGNKNLDGSSGHKKSSKEDENDFIEDYLKPNTESTTWSNEMSADILF